MDNSSKHFAYCYRNSLIILLYWPETEICSIWDGSDIKIQNIAQRHSPRPIRNFSQHGFCYIRGWMQMVLAPNDLFSWSNKYNEYNEYNVTDTFTCFFLGYAHQLTPCMLASWSHEGVVFLDFLLSSHSVTSFLFPYLGSTDAPCSRLGDPVPPPSKMATPFTGSAHTPLPGSGTATIGTILDPP